MNRLICEVSKTSKLVEEFIKNSQSFLKIVTFRFASDDFAQMLINKAKTGVDIEIITTPSDSIAKEDLRTKVEQMYENLKLSGIKLLLCHWETGEPRLTPTSMSGRLAAGIGEKWYALHLQLFVNEKQALMTSRNLVPEENLEVYYLSSESTFTEQALDKYNLLKNLYFAPIQVKNVALQGKILDFLDEKMLKDTLDVHSQTGRFNVKHYSIKQLAKADLRRGFLYALLKEG